MVSSEALPQFFIVRGLSAVMPAHSRPKDGVLSHAYVAGIHVLRLYVRSPHSNG
jgi:hypothetical protein